MYIVLLFIIIAAITPVTIFQILRITRKMNLLHTPNERSSHSVAIPGFGGIAFFINIVVSCVILQSYDINNIWIIYLITISMMFVLGLLDDIKNWTYKPKIIIELIIISLFLWSSGFTITDLHGFFFVNNIPVIISTIISFLIILFLVQAYNFIDGIDGFASVIGSVMFFSFAYLFWLIGDYFFLGISVACIGSLFAFFWFNISHQRKIFMGDTGTMILGFTLGVFTIRLLGLSEIEMTTLPFEVSKLPYIILFILFIPIFDVLRIMIIRKLQGKSIFTADRNHVHHIISDYGLSHRRTSVVCGFINLLFIFIAFLNAIHLHKLFLIIQLIGTIIFVVMFLFFINSNQYAKRFKVILRKAILKRSPKRIKAYLLLLF